jgi:hypothetical protein
MASQSARSSPPQRFPDWLSVILFITCKDAGNGLQKGLSGEVDNGQKIVNADYNLPHTPFYIIRRETVTSGTMTESYDTKSATFPGSALDLV